MQEFWKLLTRNWWLISLAGLVSASTAWWFTQRNDDMYKSHTLINTGTVSGFNVNGSDRKDWNVANNQFENVLSLARSREVLEELNARLLAYCLGREPSISQKWLDDIHQELTESVKNQIIDPNSAENTYSNIVSRRNTPGKNEVKTLLDGKHPILGMEYLLENLTVRREGASDIMRVEYRCPDPYACKKALDIFVQIFCERYVADAQKQTASIVEFFERVTREAADALKARENNMVDYVSRNRIINYYEQTRFIAGKREDFNEAYYKELMNLAAADSARVNIETRLAARIDIPVINQRLLDQRNNLSNIHRQMAELEVAPASGGDTLNQLFRTAEYKKLQDAANSIKQNLRSTALASYAVERTPEGVETRRLLENWLENWVRIEESQAKLNVLNKRKSEFDKVFSEYAPIGSNMKRLERDIDLTERSYLENLNSYNQALLQQRSLALASALKIIDSPFLPDNPEPSRRMWIVIAAAIAGTMLALGALVLNDISDKSLRNPERAQAMTGLEVASAIPFVARKVRPGLQAAISRSTGELFYHLNLERQRQQVEESSPMRIAVMSMHPGEGKSFTASLAVRKLREAGEKVLWLRPDAPKKDPPPQLDDRFFLPDEMFTGNRIEHYLAKNSDPYGDSYRYVFLEIPALEQGIYPTDWLAHANVLWLVCDAHRVWGTAENRMLNLLKSSLRRECRLILNGVLIP